MPYASRREGGGTTGAYRRREHQGRRYRSFPRSLRRICDRSLTHCRRAGRRRFLPVALRAALAAGIYLFDVRLLASGVVDRRGVDAEGGGNDRAVRIRVQCCVRCPRGHRPLAVGVPDSADLHPGHIADGISKIDTSDVTVYVLMHDALRENGEMIFQLLKTQK